MTDYLEHLYAEIAKLTRRECEHACRVPLSCCSAEYCRIADEFARERGVVYEETGHPTLRFMGPSGCVVPPHHRPMCAVFTCAVSAYGGKLDDEDWNERYWELRDRIATVEAERERARRKSEPDEPTHLAMRGPIADFFEGTGIEYRRDDSVPVGEIHIRGGRISGKKAALVLRLLRTHLLE